MTTRYPRPLFLLALIGVAFLLLPLAALPLRLNWSSIPTVLSSGAALQALWLSLRTAGAATLLCLILGVPLALLIARSRPAVAGVLRALVTLPLVLPPLVGGMALLYLFGRSGLLGPLLTQWHISLPFTTAAVVIAQTFVAMPFLVVSLEGALRTAGTKYEAVAATLGSPPWHTFRTVTLPLVLPGLVSGLVLSFSRALGEFGATALFAGNFPGVTRTMPLAIYTAFNGAGVSEDAALALALMLVVVAVVILLLMRSWHSEPAR